jgi:hypothetical protein
MRAREFGSERQTAGRPHEDVEITMTTSVPTFVGRLTVIY